MNTTILRAVCATVLLSSIGLPAGGQVNEQPPFFVTPQPWTRDLDSMTFATLRAEPLTDSPLDEALDAPPEPLGTFEPIESTDTPESTETQQIPALPRTPALPGTGTVSDDLSGSIYMDPALDKQVVEISNACRGYCCEPYWAVGLDALALSRSASHEYVLVRQGGLPTGADTLSDVLSRPVLLDASDLDFSYDPGWRVNLRRRTRYGFGLELLYFEMDGWSSGAMIADPDVGTLASGPAYMFFADTPSDPDDYHAFKYSSDLRNIEMHLRYPLGPRVRLLGGWRLIDLDESLTAWSNNFDLYRTTTSNRLIGPQVGADVSLWDKGGRLHIKGTVKAALYYNDVNVSARDLWGGFPTRIAERVSAGAGNTAVSTELGIEAGIRLTHHWSLRMGYQAMWIGGIALAPEQLDNLDYVGAAAGHFPTPTATLFGKSADTDGDLILHGGYVGAEFRF
jgi:hypothetical protein